MLQFASQILVAFFIVSVLHYLLLEIKDKELENIIAQYEDSKEQLREIKRRIQNNEEYAELSRPDIQKETTEMLRGNNPSAKTSLGMFFE